MAERAGRRPSDDLKSNQSAFTTGTTYFLGIGINAYQHWNRLGNAVRDVEAIAQLLQKEFGLEPDQTVLLLDEEAGQDDIIHLLEQLAYKIKETDSLLIYYAGHGHLDAHQNGFWIPVDGPNDQKKKSRWIRNSTLINDYVAKINSLHTLLISDSCYSGSLFTTVTRGGVDRAEELMSLRSRWAICSGRSHQAVSDGDGPHSPFAQAILDTLSKSKQEYITAGWLLEQVSEQTRTNYDQLPDGGPLNGVGHERGQYVFRRNQLVKKVEAATEEKPAVNLGSELAKYNCNRRGILDCFWDNFRRGEAEQVPMHLFFLHFDRDQMSETLVHRIITELHLQQPGVKWSGFDHSPIRDVTLSDRSTPEQQADLLQKKFSQLLELPKDCRGNTLPDFLAHLADTPSPRYRDQVYLPYILDISIPEKVWPKTKVVLRQFLQDHLTLTDRGKWVPVFFLTLHLKPARIRTGRPKPRFFGLLPAKPSGIEDPYQEVAHFMTTLPAPQQTCSTLLPPLRSIDEDDLHDWSKQFRQELTELERIELVERIIHKLGHDATGWPMKLVNPHLIRVCDEIKNAEKHI